MNNRTVTHCPPSHDHEDAGLFHDVKESCCLRRRFLPARGADAQTQADDAWRLQFTPYVWLTGLDGHVKPSREAHTVHVDKSFSDLLNNLDAAFFLSGTARKGRWVLHGDASHAATSDSATLPLGLSARARVRQTSMTLAGGYNWRPARQSSVDLLGGVRLWDIHASVRVSSLGSVQSSTSFVDPLIALRWRYDFAPQWSSLVYVDAGGFGVGSDSTWQMLGAINYQWRDNIHLSLGYRHLRVSYRSDGKRLAFGQGGPLVGATFQF